MIYYLLVFYVSNHQSQLDKQRQMFIITKIEVINLNETKKDRVIEFSKFRQKMDVCFLWYCYLFSIFRKSKKHNDNTGLLFKNVFQIVSQRF